MHLSMGYHSQVSLYLGLEVHRKSESSFLLELAHLWHLYLFLQLHPLKLFLITTLSCLLIMFFISFFDPFLFFLCVILVYFHNWVVFLEASCHFFQYPLLCCVSFFIIALLVLYHIYIGLILASVSVHCLNSQLSKHLSAFLKSVGMKHMMSIPAQLI